MKQYKQFINWCEVPDFPPKKPRKVPCDANQNPIDPHNPAHWLTLEQAQSTGLNIGFVLTENDPYFLLDLDDIKAPDGQWNAWSQSIYAQFPGAFAEISHSDKGIHIMGQCDATRLVDRKNKSKDSDGNQIEFYTHGRFVALGSHQQGNIDLDWTDTLLRVVPARDAADSAPVNYSGPVPEWNGPEDDAELIQKALNARGSAAVQLGDKASFADLWGANVPVLSRVYPSPSEDEFDRSSADAALMSHLAFWSGKDYHRMDRLFRLSGLMRDKYENRQDYQQSTITGAIRHCRAVYGQKTLPELPPVKTGALARPTGETRRSHWLNYFNQDFYFLRNHGGKPVVFEQNSDRFQHMHDFVAANSDALIDDGETAQGKAKFRNAAKWWCESPDGLKFDYREFRPDHAPGWFKDASGKHVVNTWRGWPVDPAPGDWPTIDRFLKTIICDNDTEKYGYVISWISQLVNEPEKKPQVALVLQSRQQGTGKGTFYQLLTWLVGDKYCLKSADPKAFVGDFNDAVDNKLILCADEAFAANDKALDGKLKTLIDADSLDIHGKGLARVTRPNCARVLFLSNDPWAAHIEARDRRYVVFEVPGYRMEGRLASKPEWANLIRSMKSEVAAFLHYLVNEHPVTFDTMPPLLNTRERALMQQQSLKGLERIACQILQSGEIRGYLDANGWFVTSSHLKDMAARNGHRDLSQPIKLARLLSNENFRPMKHGGKTVRATIVKSLTESRRHFETVAAIGIDWDDDGDWQEMSGIS